MHYWSKDMLKFDFLDKGLGIASPARFVYDFPTKMFLMLYSIKWPNFIVWLSLLLEILSNISIATVCYPGCEVMGFETNLIFLIKPFFLHDQKFLTKTWISLERKELLRWNEKHFPSFLKGFQLSKIVSDLRVHLWRNGILLIIWLIDTLFKMKREGSPNE